MYRLLYLPKTTKVECRLCRRVSEEISKALGVCGNCIRERAEKALPFAAKVHAESREKFCLPLHPPKDENGVKCNLCVNECSIPKGGKGYCGLRENADGRLVHLAGTPSRGLLEWYYDPLPTNCVADQFCPGGTGAGYPKFAYRKGAEYGYRNLAVFYEACTFNCLFCQNWHYRYGSATRSQAVSAEELASKADKNTACICYFGGDPTPQLMHAIRTSELAVAVAAAEEKILRICWETNGSMNLQSVEKIAELSMKSGGCIKFDIKTWDENLNIALCGTTNKRTLQNFEWLAEYMVSNMVEERKEVPFLVASTLLVPGYVDALEVKGIAEFIANLDTNIPYNLLAFSSQFYMCDMPTTSRRHAEECLAAAKRAGLKRVRVGNQHLLR